jgi:PAS domain S-box-containing protein
MLALIHALLWLRDRRRVVYVLSASMALGATLNAVSELMLMFSGDIQTYVVWLKIEVLAVFVLLVSLVWFVYLYFRTASRSMALTITAMWSVSLAINFVAPNSIIFLEITELTSFSTYWGESFYLASGVRNPWNTIPDLASLLILGYLVHASVRSWHSGNKHRAGVVGGASVLFILLGGIHTPLVDAGWVRTPYMVSFAFLAIAAAMSYELVNEVLKSSRYAEKISAVERRWTLLLDKVPVFVAGLGPDGRIDYANRLLCEVSGYTAEELSQLHFTELLPEGERRGADEIFADHLRGLGSPQAPMSMLTRNGSQREVIWSLGLVADGDGRTTSMLSVGADVTDSVRAQAELQHTQREMDRLMRATLLGEVAAGLAHELNQPLTAILSNAQAAQRMLATGSADLAEIRAIVEDIIADDKRASDVILGLRAMLRRSEGVRQPVDVNAAIRGVGELLNGELRPQNISLQLELEPGIPCVQANAVQVQQVVMNLLLNSIKAMRDTPEDQRWLVVQSQVLDDTVRVSVIDRGPGIEPGLLSTLFDPFATTRSDGLGMGLAICRRIVEDHGGRISADNKSEGGVVFNFTLPLSATKVAVAE